MKSFFIAEILGLHEELSAIMRQTASPGKTPSPTRIDVMPDVSSRTETRGKEVENKAPASCPAAGSEPFECKTCNKRFSEEHQLVYHQRIHDRNKCCPTCGLFFRSKSKFKTHLRTSHSTGKKIQCRHCDKRFRDKTALMKHMAKQHQIPMDDPKDKSLFEFQKCVKEEVLEPKFKIEPNEDKPDIIREKICAKSFFKSKILQRYNESVQTS